MAQTPLPRRVTLDDLIALNEEILVLSRGGVPLEGGLLATAMDRGGRVGRLASVLGERLANGEPWERIAREDEGLFPPIYGAVVEAGLRAGHLPMAIESLTSSLRRVAELRRVLGLALFYPLLLIVLAYAFLVAGVIHLLPTMIGIYVDLGIMPSAIHSALLWIIANVSVWAPIAPACLGMLLAWRFGRGWLPRHGRHDIFLSSLVLTRHGRLAAFLEILALLVGHGTTLDRSLELAGEACGDPDLRTDAAALAAAVRAGSREVSYPGRRSLPPMLRAVLLTEANGARLRSVLRREAETAARLATLATNRMSFRIPLMAAIVGGGTTVVVFATAVLGPWYWLMVHLGRPG